MADVSVQQPSGQPFSDGPHVYALDWERDAITSEPGGVRCGKRRRHAAEASCSLQACMRPAGPACPQPPWPAAPCPRRTSCSDLLPVPVSVDGVVSRRFVSRRLDPTDGWFTGAAGAPPEAPFDAPFNIIL